MLCHSLHNVDLYQVLPWVHKIIITGSLCNVKSVRSVLSYFEFEKNEKESYLRAFKENKNAFVHWCLDVEKRTVTLLEHCEEENMNSLVDVSAGDDRSLALSMLGELENPGKATAVFNLIFKHVKKRVNTDDFTIKLKSGKTREGVTISLIEYLDAVTTAGRPKDKTLLQFHKYIQRFVRVPKCFILNQFFR